MVPSPGALRRSGGGLGSAQPQARISRDLPRCGLPIACYNPDMTKVAVKDIARDLIGYLRRVEEGETLLILRDDKPVAEIKPVPTPPQGPRPFGLCAGQFTVPDDFDAPLPDEVLKEFEGR